jgi:hypothetical protein
MTVADFIAKWRFNELKARSVGKRCYPSVPVSLNIRHLRRPAGQADARGEV